MKNNKKGSSSSLPAKHKFNEIKSSKPRNISISEDESHLNINDKSEELQPPSSVETRDESENEDNSRNEPSYIKQSKNSTTMNSSQINSGKRNSSSVNLTFSLKELTIDDEIYTFQCPRNLEKINLLNKNINFTQNKATVTIKGETFQLQLFDSSKKFITLAAPKNDLEGSLIRLPLSGHCIVQKVLDIPIEDSVNEDFGESHTVIFPSDIKVRHPLLGNDWKAYIDAANAALKKEVEKEKIPEIVRKKSKRKSSDSEMVSPKKKKKSHI